MIWRIGRARVPIEDTSMSCIVDDIGHRYIDSAYRDMGIQEGWLIRTGYFRDGKDRLVFTYRLKKVSQTKLP